MADGKLHTLSDITTEQLVKTVTTLYNEIGMLQKVVETKNEDKQISDIASIRQTRALQKLRDLAVSPIGAIGYIKACCLSGHNVDALFDWQGGFFDNRGKDLLDSLYEPENLIPMLKQHNVLSHVSSISSFAKNLPGLANCEMNTQLYDALHKARVHEQSFSSQLANLFEEEYNNIHISDEIDKKNQKRILSVIHDLASKDYSSMQILSAKIAEKQCDTDTAKAWYHEVLRNKFASSADITTARIALNLDNPVQLKSPHTYIQEQASGITDSDKIQQAYQKSAQNARD